MCFSEKERKVIGNFHKYITITKTNKELYLFKWKYGTTIYAISDIIYETDNNLNFDDSNYEEYIGICMKIKKICCLDERDNLFPDKTINNKNISEWFKENGLFEFNYHNFPDEIYNSKGELISKRDK
ncbi:MAG: hypothetical protein Q4B84_04195 [Clostridia bacterium]|nr:hypothetical protein [Clostridia bacterium]